MTKKETLKAIRAFGLATRWIPESEEFRVAFLGMNNEASAYYTQDANDAIETARSMSAYRPLA